MNDAIPLKRTAKGKKPQYFHDPATDRLFAMVVTLTQELSVAKERIDTLEDLLTANSIASETEIKFFEPSSELQALREQERAAFIKRVFRSSQTQDTEVNDRMEEEIQEVLT